MITTPVTGAAASTLQSTAAAEQQIGATFDNFLSMLTTQLRNQDPLSPMDTTEFTNQLVNFTQVEQQIAGNRKLDELIALQSGGRFGEALDYLGRDVEIAGGTFSFDGEPAHLAYELPVKAAAVQLQVIDRTGRVMWSAAGNSDAGRHDLDWDGKTADGGTVPAGSYTLQVIALDNAGAPISTATYARGQVTGIQSDEGQTVLMMGETPVALDKVIAIAAGDDG